MEWLWTMVDYLGIDAMDILLLGPIGSIGRGMSLIMSSHLTQGNTIAYALLWCALGLVWLVWLFASDASSAGR